MPAERFRLPLRLPGSGDTYTGTLPDVRPVAQWIELPGSGAAMPSVAVPLIGPEPYFNYQILTASGTLSRLWLRRETSALMTGAIQAFVYVNAVYQNAVVTIPSGVTEAEMVLGVSVVAGDNVQILILGGNNTSVISGILRDDTTLYRLLPSPLGRLWIVVDGEWVAPYAEYVDSAGTWNAALSSHAMDGGAWVQLT